ncbi:hypothetical protein E5S67_05847 [Microcoleus sp. IPMA8]|uniref:Uncharacterized protein n=2 Tax=Microcoleus TaxID=44471 RepID=A0ABX2D638_9CYAN|nr:hypothetical protein [Microcoleus asticus]NQE38064.1 hypothetical protein [Microcoleus asticus IPMA8]
MPRDLPSEPGIRNQGVDLTPYHLCDAYAVRGSVLGIDPAILARWMVHSLQVHFDKYHHHISKRDFETA